MRLSLLIGFLIIVNQFSFAQSVVLSADTLTVVSLYEVDDIAKTILSSSRYLLINDKCYCADNIPFESLRADCSGFFDKNLLFFSDYSSIVNEKSISKFLAVLKKKKIRPIGSFLEDSLSVWSKNRALLDFLNCVQSSGEDFHVSMQKVVMVYFLLDCEMRRGTNHPVFCREKVDLTKSPVVLNVIKMLD